jgi:hypothetical protein
MKKIIDGLFAAIMMAAGLVAFSGSAAQAACPEYTGCSVTVTTEGNGRPPGRVTVTVVRGKGGYEFTDSKKYNDRTECFKTTKLNKKGNYVVKARFDRKPGSAFKDSDNRDEFKVTRG